MELRPYQLAGKAQAAQAVRDGHTRILLVGSTGMGKTVVACDFVRGSVAKGNRVLFLAHRKELIEQTSWKLDAYDVEHGVIMADHWRNRPAQPVQVASVQTLIRRLDRWRHFDLVIVDEAHRALAKSYLQVIDALNPRVVLGLTATPVRTDGRGLGDLFTTIVEFASIQELIQLGYLVPPRVFAPSTPDTSSLHIRRGDYVVDEAERMMDKKHLIGDMVAHYLEHASDRLAVGFATTVQHSLHCRDAFRAAGIAAAHIDYKTPAAQRDDTIARWKRGEIQVVWNVGLFTEGFDFPELGAAILARPTASFGLYLQMAGRILRPAEGKADAIILDHAGCALEHGLPTDPREWTLETSTKRQRKQRDGDIAFTRCPPPCFAIYQGAVCPECGLEAPVKPRQDIEVKDGKLVEVGTDPLRAKVLAYYQQKLEWARDRKTRDGQPYKRGWAFYQVVHRFGDVVAKRYLPKRQVPSWVRMKNANRDYSTQY